MCTSSVQPILALLGLPVAGNPTQFMVEKALDHHDLDWRYLSLEVPPDSLADAVRGMRAMGFRGGNCTSPHQEAVVPLLDRLTPSAELAGAVNCIYRDQQAFIGDNTKGRAFASALARRTDPAGKRAVVLGSGCMARAIAVELALAKAAEVVVVARNEASGRAIQELLGGKLETPASFVPWQAPYPVAAETQLLVAAIPAGEDPDAALPLLLDQLSPDAIVADTAYDPPRTWLLRQAAERGCKTIEGLEIFIEQAVLNFRLWTAVDADTAVLRDAVEEFLEL